MIVKAIVVILGAVFWTGVAGAQAPDPAKVAAGKKVYEDSKCSKCHGIAGHGDHGQRVLEGVSEKLSAAEIRKWITSPTEMTAKLPKKPKEPMKKVDLTDAQVDALVAYVQSLKK